MSKITQQIDDFFGDFGVRKQTEPAQIIEPEIIEPEVQEVAEPRMSTVELYAKWVSDYEQSRLQSS